MTSDEAAQIDPPGESADATSPMASTPRGPAHGAAVDADESEFQRLDPRSMRLERVESVIVLGVIAALLGSGGMGLFWVVPFPYSLLIPLSWLILAAMAVVSLGYWPRWEYDRWSYRVDDRVVELRHGVVWRVSVSIPLSRLQHIDLHRGPLERRLGLATLELHTAGTRSASHQIPGLDEATAARLRDQLIDIANRGAHGPAKV